MTDYITKKELEEVLDKKLAQYQATILDAVNYQHQETKKEISELRTSIRELTTTLDNFLKHLTDWEDEFTILKAEVDQMKSVFKEKFGVDILVQGK